MKKQLCFILFFKFILNSSALYHTNTLDLDFIYPEGVVKCSSSNPQEFQCHSESKILSKVDVCNGIRDCSDGSDENFCTECQTSFSCKQFSTSTNSSYSKCLLGTALCNGIKDCQNGEDESRRFCRSNYSSTEYQCPSSKKMCIPNSFKCDGDVHCRGIFDEENCKGHCTNGAMWCPISETCIPKWKICDGIKDCKNGDDEKNCSCEECHGENKALCLEPNKMRGTCIRTKHICDGIQHCPHQLDEKGCPGWCEKTANDEDDYIDCNGTKIHKLHACDGFHPECNGKCSKCHWTAHDCGGGRCLRRDRICDGIEDCENGSDEKNCNHDSDYFVACKPIKGYANKDIPKKYLCDGVIDCPEQFDELQCSSCKGEDTFHCEADQKCIKGIQRCNGFVDCESDLSDEINCNCDDCSISEEFLYMCSGGNRCIKRSWLCHDPLYTCPNSPIDDSYCAIKMAAIS